MLRQLPNPDNEPRYVTTSYQRQNENLFAVQTGIDTTNPYDDGTNVIVPIGGVVEVNGTMYSVTSDVTLPKPDPDTAYWIVVVPSDDGETASLELVTRPGVWNPERQGCYFTEGGHNNRRTLNWVSRGGLADMPSGEGDAFSENTKINSKTISLRRGWHFVRLESGLGGGDGGSGLFGDGQWSSNRGGSGGQVNIRNKIEMIFFSDKPFYNVKIGGNGQNGSNGPFNSGQGTQNDGGGGGGGSGEESVFDGFSTGMVLPGNGGNGAGGGIGGGAGNNGISGINTSSLSGGAGGLAGHFLGGGGGGGGGGAGGGGSAAINGGGGGAGGSTITSSSTTDVTALCSIRKLDGAE